jgi:YD repeat-containing protein
MVSRTISTDAVRAVASSGTIERADTAGGAFGNRTQLVDVYTEPGEASVTTTTDYCYDWADRLLSTTVTNPISGANGVASGLDATDIAYDSRGNTVLLAGMVFTYDGNNRHTTTTHVDGTVVSNVRDATGRIVSRTIIPPGLHRQKPRGICILQVAMRLGQPSPIVPSQSRSGSLVG